ncbi:hypothetical protein D3C71_1719260 [compost metagenome]
MPISSAHSDWAISDSGHQASSNRPSASALVRLAWPRSAHSPARAPAKAPTTPTSPSAPMAVCETPAARSGSTSALQKILNAANISSASSPRTCSRRSWRSSVNIDATRRG